MAASNAWFRADYGRSRALIEPWKSTLSSHSLRATALRPAASFSPMGNVNPNSTEIPELIGTYNGAS
jgi:hypothetical protein